MNVGIRISCNQFLSDTEVLYCYFFYCKTLSGLIGIFFVKPVHFFSTMHAVKGKSDNAPFPNGTIQANDITTSSAFDLLATLRLK